MKHQKLVATLLGISTLTCSISQTKKKLQSSDNQKNLEEQTKLNATRKPENIKNSNKDEVISIAYPVSQLTNILIDNNNRSLEIRTWSESKVKISAIYSSQGNNINGGNNLLLFEDMNIHTKSIGNSFTIKTGIANKQNSSQNNWGYESDPAIKKTVTIYVPSVNKLSIESKYADITVKNYLKKVSICLLYTSRCV